MPTSAAATGGGFDGLSIVVVTWNSERELPDLLASIDEHLPQPYEVIVVDNASSDRTVELAEAWRGPCRVIALDENRGFGPANNIGVREARYEAVVLLNPDTLLVDGSLVDLAKVAQETGAICGPELLNPDGTRQPSASAPPAGWEVAVQALVPGRLMPTRVQACCEPWRVNRRTPVGWLTGACLVAPRSVLLLLGPFDGRSSALYSEDLDLGVRARSTGFLNLFAPEVARVVHHGERSAAQGLRTSIVRRKLDRRRAVVTRHFGRARERYDFAMQVVMHLTRFAMKTMLTQPAQRERRWLGALIGGGSVRHE